MLSRVKAVVKQLPGVGPFLRNLNRRLVDWRNRRRDARTYEPWIQNRLATRSSEYTLAPGVQTAFDILTITYETDPLSFATRPRPSSPRTIATFAG